MILAILSMLASMMSIQSGASLAKQIFPLAGVIGTSTLRVGFAALILSLLWRPWNYKMTPAQKWSVIFYGVSLGLMNLTFYLSLQRIPLGICVALEFTGPLAVAVFNSKRKSDFLWIALALIGIFFVLPSTSNPEGFLDPWGIFFAFTAGAFWAGYILFGQRTGKSLPGGVATSSGMIVAALTVLPFGLFLHEVPLSQTVPAMPMAFAVALLSSAVPYSFEMVALKRLPAHTFGVLLSLAPALAALTGYLLLGEKLSFSQWLAVICIVLASAGCSWSTHRQSKKTSQSR